MLDGGLHGGNMVGGTGQKSARNTVEIFRTSIVPRDLQRGTLTLPGDCGKIGLGRGLQVGDEIEVIIRRHPNG